MLCISLPIPIIVNNFNKFYEKAKIEEEILAKKKKSSWEEAKRGQFNSFLGLQGLCHEITIFLMAYQVKSVLSVYALVVFKNFFVFIAKKIKFQVFTAFFENTY